ncbi:MAG: hypothetical protein ACOX0W_07605 [Sphaerochaetaceae bacterium]
MRVCPIGKYIFRYYLQMSFTEGDGMVKKRVLLACVFISIHLLAWSNSFQKIYTHSSDIYKTIQHLYISSGKALPSSSAPFSGEELLMMAQHMNHSSLSQHEQQLLKEVVSLLQKEEKVVSFSLETSLEAYLHSNTTHFVDKNDWIRGANQRLAPLKLILETSIGESLYGYSELPFQGLRYAGVDTTTQKPFSDLYGKHTLTTNLTFISELDRQLDMSVPQRAFVAFGSKHWSAQIGRENISWGSALSGNLLLSDSVSYHNVARFTAFTPKFKYTFLTSFFPHPKNYYDYSLSDGVIDDSTTREWDGTYQPMRYQIESISGLRMFMAHRLEWRLFNEKVGFALSEAIMYQSEDNTLDLAILSPSMIFHNYYIKANANSIITLELDYTPIKHLNIYSQIAIDEFAVIGAEKAPGVASSAEPNAFGFILGIHTAHVTHKGRITATVEGAYTNPYLYLRGLGYEYRGSGDDVRRYDEQAQQKGVPGVNFIVAVKEHFSNGYGIYYDEQFLGYPYGPDALVLNAHISYDVPRKWSITGSLFYMMHGTHDQWTLWSRVYSDPGESKPPYHSTPTTTHDTENHRYDDVSDRNAVSHTFSLGLQGEYNILSSLKVYGEVDYVLIVNPGNNSSRSPISDIQLTAGISYAF